MCLNRGNTCIDSVEIISSNDGGEIVLWDPLSGSCHGLELSESLGIVDAFFEKVKFWLAHSHLPIESEEALSGIVEWLEADGLEGEVLRVASEHIQRLLLALLGMLRDHTVRVPLILIPDDFFSALVKVHVEEDQVFEGWHVVHFCQVEVNFLPSDNSLGD